jgi:hypothetical protein
MKRVASGILLGVLLIAAIARCTAPSAVQHQVAAPTEEQRIQAVLMALPSYATIEEAGLQAILRAYKCSPYYECTGAIAQRPDGRFVVGSVHSDYSGDKVEGAHGVPKGWRLAGDFHTHPCLPESHYPGIFSPQDIEDILEHGVVGFLGDLCTGKVHMFDPRTMAPHTHLFEDGSWSTEGKVIGVIPVTGVSLEPVQGM